ncbi:hypothetical protein J4Q44_G00304490 [Coregonus suidteri]|uniref:Uncharacterized protein n=1 Tax=Coregonus suidteri TaxID=861788 RepID=A0AAN8QBR2_9TELE
MLSRVCRLLLWCQTICCVHVIPIFFIVCKEPMVISWRFSPCNSNWHLVFRSGDRTVVYPSMIVWQQASRAFPSSPTPAASNNLELKRR